MTEWPEMKPTTADVAVIGTGVVGLAVAVELLARGLSVTVVGSLNDELPGQASRAAGAMLTVFSEVEAAHPTERVTLEVGERLAARGGYEDWLAGLSTAGSAPVPLTPGVWVLANSSGDDDAAELAAIEKAATAAGGSAEHHDPASVPGLNPRRTSRAYDALWLPDEATVDTADLMTALSSTVLTHPNGTWVNNPAVELSESGTAVRVHAGYGQVIEAEHIVLAAGTGIPALLAGADLDKLGLPPILAGAGVSLLVRCPLVRPTAAIRTVNRGYACGSHLVPRADGLLYIGGTNRLTTTPDGHRRASLDEIATLIHDASAELATGLRGAELMTVRLGHRPYTLDHLPLVGRTNHPRVLVATATYRCGILLAPHLARLIAAEILTPGATAEHPYRPTRPMPVPDLRALIEAAGASLAELVRQPGGQLSPGAEETLGAFLRHALARILADTGPGTEPGVLALRRLWQRAPVAECLPLIYDLAGRQQ